MTDAPFVAAADWGTTRLRLWLLERDGAVLAERRSDDGMLSARPDRFETVLESHLAALSAPAGLPVLVCGMAGARQGWVEAGYIDVPARLDTLADGAVAVPGIRRSVRILPGLAQRGTAHPDVMRGEETQLAGALDGQARQVLCLPGTHSKWVEAADGAVTGFATYMTGELFATLAGHSILSHSLGEERRVDPGSEVFAQWCGRALAAPAALTSSLFAIRAAGLLDGLGPQDGAAALSGLLIGTEIAAARQRHGTTGRVILVASGGMADLYQRALAIAGIDCSLVDADEAVRTGLLRAALHLHREGAP